MIVLWVAAAIAALFVLVGVICFLVTCLRMRVPGLVSMPILKRTPYAQFAQEICDGAQMLKTLPQEHLQVMSYDGKLLHATFVPCENPKGTILLFHGYRSSAELDFGLAISYYRSLGFQLLLCDQRSHGRSQGLFITFGAKERYDVLSWVTYLGQKLGAEHPMFLSGLSMGAATVMMASCFKFPANIRGVIADCGFTSPYEIVRHVVKKRVPFLPADLMTGLISLFTVLFAGFSLKECSAPAAVAESSLPLLLLHGEADHFVPCEMSQTVFEACRGEKTLITVPGAAHGLAFAIDRKRVQAALGDFLYKHLPKEESL